MSAARRRSRLGVKITTRIYDRTKHAQRKLICLKHYGGDPPKCACCGETELGFLSLDHVNNDGNKQRKKLLFAWLIARGLPDEPAIQVLCFNCNLGREFNGGVCPHKHPWDPLADKRRHRRGKSTGSACESEAGLFGMFKPTA